ncbi:hypothetical protein [Campylobacter ureolyticus]|uniref:hypothetical protein n=1 Tax=Campylobacter ureolyticus TaxID=827 RepID=UPI0029138A59|nr:hypothetical protein [Campylobacter ureolyticus]MDU7071194.1 hypothetical protein [Campylobacter ureolyticus]
MKNGQVIGDNSHGFNNEQLLVNSLNNKKYKDLNAHLKKIIKQISLEHSISINDDTIIKSTIATKEIDYDSNKKINPKPDLYIELNEMKFGISTKMGVGNSVHQEKVESFINWIKNNPNIKIDDETIYDDLRLLIWGDGTLDGKAPINRDIKGYVIGRHTTKEFKKLYPKQHEKIQNFLNNNSSEIIKRALFLGKTNNEVHYIYHGTPINGVWISQKELLDFNLSNKLDNSTFNVGRLSFQIYNADKKGTPSGSKKRGEIQFKYGQLENDIQKLMLLNASNIGTYEGNLEEFNFSKLMNRNKDHKFWNYLDSKLTFNKNKNYYVVKVEGQKFSKNSNKKVMCKSDNYIIETENPLDKKILLKNEFQLTESNLPDNLKYKIIPNSGISIKQRNSKNYTITKMTVNNFISAFDKYLSKPNYISAAIILYCTKDQVNKNYKIAKDLDIDESYFMQFFKDKFNINIDSLLDYKSISLIARSAKKLITEIIENNLELKLSLFTGKGWFDPPYYISFLYNSGQLSDNIFIPYRIDNGSGRSKGIYTIIIKPQ